MVSMTDIRKTNSSQFTREETFPKGSLRSSFSFKRQRSDNRPASVMRSNNRPPMLHRRSKSLPIHLQEDEYTGKPLFWFRRSTNKVPYHSMPAFPKTGESNEGRPPRQLLRLLSAPIRKMRQSRSLDQPFLEPETRTNSFETVTTAIDEYMDDQDDTFVAYSDDEDDYLDDGDEDETLRGLCFLEEERE